ncbi:multidrug transporter [Ureibacillus massiliensis 4400831 = CIP 108448 = CCUG 49529]|uniref:Multidrug transporter n=1 Tax=Ureibacillus massiliensis 4400831 = CIP 108448 = CCUG 49529 TaxID=1211035 RepID=A0A0A3JXX3_9BACL|nr:MFS transporter [Ureibacillus massiliensis]KGR91822.1 multidrug transporter [Ureibacillus massiliensis 4400831 = CIP 108448 = CCUG 49529]
MKKTFLLLMSIQFLVYLGFGIIIPVLPEVIVQYGWDEIHVGGLLTIYAIASFFTAPFWGHLSDKFGRKQLILLGLIGFSMSFIMFSIFIDQLFILYLSRIIGGLFSGALYTAVTGYISDISTNENRNKYMGFMGMSIGLGFIFGPAIGGLLGHINLQLPFVVSSILIALLFIYGLILIKEPSRRGDANKRAIIPIGASKMFEYRVRYLFLFSFFVTFILAGVEATFQLFQIEKIAITPLQLGWLFMFSGFFDAAIQGGLVRRIKDGSETKWLIWAQIITAIGLFSIVFTTNLFLAGLSLCIFTAGNALARTCVVSLTTKESGGRYATGAGLSYSMDNLGRIIGPLFFTSLFKIDISYGYILSIVLALLSIILIFLFTRSSNSLRFEHE